MPPVSSHHDHPHARHAELSTTQIYTQVAMRQLKAVHNATHPANQTQTKPNKTKQGRRKHRPKGANGHAGG